MKLESEKIAQEKPKHMFNFYILEMSFIHFIICEG